MSIIRVGLAETKKFSDGYEAIFGKKKAEAKKSAAAPARGPKSRKKKAGKKK